MSMTANESKASASKPLAILIFEDAGIGYGGAEDGFSARLASALGEYFRVAPPISKGGELWPMLFSGIPAVIVVSQTIRDMDAIGLIRGVRSSKFRFDIRFFLCCSEINSSVKSICLLNGIDGCFSVSDDPAAAAESIYEKYVELAESSAQRRLDSIRMLIEDGMFFKDQSDAMKLGEAVREELLFPLGFDPAHKGSEYIELMICLRALGCETNMSLLYDIVSECRGVSPASVEKAMRYAIERAWCGASPYLQYKLFGNTVDAERGKPTNAELVETLARHAVERMSEQSKTK